MEEKLNELFNLHSVEELQKIVRKKRHDVEHKKDELRYLVGERHRDVIEASDAIKDMKRLSDNVSGSTIALKDCCLSLNVPQQPAPLSGSSKLTDLSVAAHLKLLLDIPEMIWNFMDNADHVSAVMLFFLGRHISARLQLSSQLHAAGIEARVLVKRLWNSLVHMESAVLAACRRRLTAPPSSWKELCNSLVALVLMEKVSLSRAVDEYLDGRMVALRRIFNNNENARLSSEDDRSNRPPLPIRRQVILASKLLISTLNCTEFLFYEHPEANLSTKKGALQYELEKLRKWSLRDAKWLPTERLYTYLSEDMRGFCLADAFLRQRSGSSSSSSDHHVPILAEEEFDASLLHDRLASWWNQALDYCRTMLQSSLTHAPNMSVVVSIRSVALSLINNWQQPHGTELDRRSLARSELSDSDHTWFQTDASLDEAGPAQVHPVLQRPVDLWTELFRDPFLARITTLLNAALDSCFDEWTAQVLSLIKSSCELELSSSNDAGASTDRFTRSSFVSPSTDWAKYVWTDSKLDSFRTLDGDRANSPRTPYPDSNLATDLYTTAGLTRILRPDNAGLVVFCCLTGLPFPGWIAESVKTSHAVQSPPAHLLVFLQRLLSTSPVSAWTRQSNQNAVEWSSEQGSKPVNLSHQLFLLSPKLQGFCETLNTRIAELIMEVVQKPGGDWLQLWTIILEAMERLLARCERWVTMKAYQTGSGENGANDAPHTTSLTLSASSGLILSRACSAFVDLCPAIGAAVITAVGLIQSNRVSEQTETSARIDSSAKRGFTWSDVNYLRSTWSTKREPILTLADRLMLDCLIKATVEGQPLVSFRHSMQSTFGLDAFAGQTATADPRNDDELVSSASFLWDEEDAFAGGFDFGTVPFDEVRLQSDSTQPIDSDDHVDQSAIAVLRVPSQISLPLHQTLLAVVYLMVRLTVHTSPRSGSCKTLCLTLCNALLTEYSRVVDQFESVNKSDQPVLDGPETASPTIGSGILIEPRALQLIFDVQFLLKLLLWPPAPGQAPSKSGSSETDRNTQLEIEAQSKAKQLLSRLETFVDPFDWEVCAPRLSTAVTTVLNGVAHLYAPLMRPGVIASQLGTTQKGPEPSCTTDSASADTKSSGSTTLMPLVTTSATGNRPSFTTLSLGLTSCFDKRRYKPGSTTRANTTQGGGKLHEMNRSTMSRSSTDHAVPSSKPVPDSGFLQLGSMWFTS